MLQHALMQTYRALNNFHCGKLSFVAGETICAEIVDDWSCYVWRKHYPNNKQLTAIKALDAMVGRLGNLTPC
ncbi:MAG: hypothetical protein H6774_03240 [Pseudomonadales bacterium]|nr:hypothetical protein [Candidatus Woesebacteria bacterium]MCB9802079.1 hypothetical protein [Pseudomonadales bacterium]